MPSALNGEVKQMLGEIAKERLLAVANSPSAKNPVNSVNPNKFTRRNLPQMGSHDGGKRRRHRKTRKHKRTRRH